MTIITCAECGLLALRRLADRQLVEADMEYRETASVPGGIPVQFELLPVCSVGTTSLSDMVKEVALGYRGSSIPESKDILRAINQTSCDQSIWWHQGFSPKEHVEMLDREQWRKWQREERRKDRLLNVVLVIATAVVVGTFTLLAALLT